MGTTVITTIKDCEDLLEGALWLGTGGGGSYQEGYTLLEALIRDGYQPSWVDAADIPDQVWTVTVGLHGSIAPLADDLEDTIREAGLSQDQNEWFQIRAIKELGEYLGHEYGCIVPPELGPDSMAAPLAIGARMGVPVVDGDYIGRAVPEETQSTYCLHDKNASMFAAADPWGNVIIVKHAVNTHSLERIAKMLALSAYGVIAVATTPLPAREMKEILVHGTYSRALKIGRAIRKAREDGGDIVERGAAAAEGWRMFDGEVSRLDVEDRDGYYYGTAYLDGLDADQGQTMKVWFKNENLISWLNDEPWVTSPDLISMVYLDNGRGIYNGELQEGDRVAVIGMKGVEGFRTRKGLALAGPQHFGFDFSYRPIENILAERERVQ
jgi:DUF917 family protein